MNDQYSIEEAPIPERAGPHDGGAALLWAGVVIGVGGNIVLSAAGQDIWSIPLGVVATACIIGLIVRSWKNRR